jgi:hypothetical protein
VPKETGAPYGAGAIAGLPATLSYPLATTSLLDTATDPVEPFETFPTMPDGAPITGESSLVPSVLETVSAHATAASENTAIAATSSHAVGLRNFIVLMTDVLLVSIFFGVGVRC